MLNIVLVTARPEVFQPFVEGLSADPEVRLDHVPSASEALSIVYATTPDLVIVDSHLRDTDSLDLVRGMIRVNAMVNTAVASHLSDEDFHEKTEGLGILSRLPLEPGKAEARELLDKLRAVVSPAG